MFEPCKQDGRNYSVHYHCLSPEYTKRQMRESTINSVANQTDREYMIIETQKGESIRHFIEARMA
jgi:hypothetical protein